MPAHLPVSLPFALGETSPPFSVGEATVFTLTGAFGITALMTDQLRGEVTDGNNVVEVAYPNLFVGGDADIDTGAANLDDELTSTPGRKVVFAMSLGAMVASRWLHDYGPTSAVDPEDLSFVLIANPARAHGGFLHSDTYGTLADALAFIPNGVDVAATTVPSGTPYDVRDITRQYDGFSDWPEDEANLFAVTQAILGMNTLHANYLGVHVDHPSYSELTEGNITYVVAPTDLGDADFWRGLIGMGYTRPVAVTVPSVLATLERARPQIKEHRRYKAARKNAMPKVRLWINPDNGETDDGMLYFGQVDLADCANYEFPWKNNEGSAGNFAVRASHYVAKKIAQIPNDPDRCKNVIITVDCYGGTLRWSGLLHHWDSEKIEGTDFITATFNDDLQFLDFMLAPPNPALPLPIFQFPRVHFLFGPSRWCTATLILEQIIRLEGHPWTLPDDPFDFEQWLDILNWEDWQIHVKCQSFLLDDSLWTLLASRMDPVKTVVADALDDAQLTIVYRRILTVDGEQPEGLLVDSVKNGALVLEIVDRSGWTLPEGTFFEGTAVAGFFRSVLSWGSGFIEDTLTMVADDQTLYPDEYYQGSWMATLAAAPGVVVRDSPWLDLQSKLTYSGASAVSVIVGGNNPTADAIAELIIQAVGNLLGYFLLAGFDSLGDIAADVIMPFLTGTILAWDEWKNFSRADSLGWIHLHEIFQQGGDNNAWSLAALAALRGGFKATGAVTCHTFTIGRDHWPIPGLHFQIGDRIGSTHSPLDRMGISLIFVNQIEEMTLSGEYRTVTFLVRCGKNKQSMTQGERMARLLNKALNQIQNVGVHLIS